MGTVGRWVGSQAGQGTRLTGTCFEVYAWAQSCRRVGGLALLAGWVGNIRLAGWRHVLRQMQATAAAPAAATFGAATVVGCSAPPTAAGLQVDPVTAVHHNRGCLSS